MLRMICGSEKWRLAAAATLMAGFLALAWPVLGQGNTQAAAAEEAATPAGIAWATSNGDANAVGAWLELDAGLDYVYHDAAWPEGQLHDAWFVVDSSAFNALNRGSDHHWGVVVSVSGQDNRGDTYDRRGHKLWQDARGIIVYPDGTVKEEVWYRNSAGKPDAQVRTLVPGAGPKPMYRIRIVEDEAARRTVDVAYKTAKDQPWRRLYREEGMATVSTTRTNRIGFFSTNGKGLRGKMGARY